MPRHAKVFYSALVLIGMLTLSLGFWYQHQYQAGISKEYEPLRGTLQLGWVPGSQAYPNQYFKIQVDLVRNRVWLEYLFTYDRPGQYILQVLLPFTLQNGFGTGLSGEKWSFTNVHPYGSIVRAKYEDDKIGEGFETAWFGRAFQLNQTLAYQNRGMYSVLLPFGADIPPPVTDRMAEFDPFVGIMGQGAADNIVEILIPFNAILVQAIPGDPIVEVPANRTLLVLRWNLGHSLRSIGITYSIPSEVANFADFSFMSGLLIGIGASVTAMGVVKSYEEETHIWMWRRRRLIMASALFVLIIVVSGVLLNSRSLLDLLSVLFIAYVGISTAAKLWAEWPDLLHEPKDTREATETARRHESISLTFGGFTLAVIGVIIAFGQGLARFEYSLFYLSLAFSMFIASWGLSSLRTRTLWTTLADIVSYFGVLSIGLGLLALFEAVGMLTILTEVPVLLIGAFTILRQWVDIVLGYRSRHPREVSSNRE